VARSAPGGCGARFAGGGPPPQRRTSTTALIRPRQRGLRVRADRRAAGQWAGAPRAERARAGDRRAGLGYQREVDERRAETGARRGVDQGRSGEGSGCDGRSRTPATARFSGLVNPARVRRNGLRRVSQPAAARTSHRGVAAVKQSRRPGEHGPRGRRGRRSRRRARRIARRTSGVSRLLVGDDS